MTESELQLLAERWQNITDRDERNRFYDETIFPAICQVVVERERVKYPEPYTHLILPVGLSPEPLILSILILKPQRVYLLYTKESEKYLNRIVAESGLQIDRVDKDRVDDTNVPDIYQKVRSIYMEWQQPEHIAVDISGGKKSMIGGCALAGSQIGARLFYIDSQFIQELRKPRPGSERLAILENPYDVFGDLKLQRASDLFVQLDFVGAQRLLDELRSDTSTPDLYEARSLLCEAYAAWDDWRVVEAVEKLRQTIETVQRYGRLRSNTPLNAELSKLQAQLETLTNLNEAMKLNMDQPDKQMQLLQNPKMYRAMLGTLRAGALRQERRGKRDVAALLWYRLIELMSQQRLSHYGILTARPDYAGADLDKAELLSQYVAAMAQADKSKKETASIESLPAPIALLNGYALLKALNNEFVGDQNLAAIRGKVNARDKGLFAHGFQPLDEKNYNDFKTLAASLLQNFLAADDCDMIELDVCITIGNL